MIDTGLGEVGKAIGMARAERAADPEWKKAAFNCVVAVCRKKERFTTDDVMDLLDQTGETTHELRAMGPIMRAAARLEICRKTQTFPETQKSCRAQLHRSPIQIWDSLICGNNIAVENPYEET